MKVLRFLSVSGLIAILILSFSVISCKKGDSKVTTTVVAADNVFSEGMTIAAKWSDNNYYLAVISKIENDIVNVNYTDGTEGSVTKSDLKVIPTTLNLNIGDKVLAVWAGSRFYPGTVEQVTTTGALVKWDDGSAPSEVLFGQIIK